MIPITKNIAVTDERGNTYAPTYIRRAKGLVKNGRARWIDGNTVCLVDNNAANLTTPPPFQTHINQEEFIMDNFIIDSKQIQNASGFNSTPIPPTPPIADGWNEPRPNVSFNMEYVLSRLDRIINDNQHVLSALEMLNNIRVDGTFGQQPGSSGDIASEAKAHAIAAIVENRETTNQSMIQMLNKMYDDLKPEKGDSFKTQIINRALAVLGDLEDGDADMKIEMLTEIVRECIRK